MDCCYIQRGIIISKDYINQNPGIYPVYSSQTSNNGELGRISSYKFDGKYITWTTDGCAAGTVFYHYGKFNITNVCGLLAVKDKNLLSTKYLFYYLQANLKKYVNFGIGFPKLMSNVVANIKIPIPSIYYQNKIVNILNKLEQYSLDLSFGLPLEISLRQKQYNYYLEQILNFEKGII